ncbi:MAG: Crp/Fnr family transcriptional regulator [Mucilaginibacter sp.]|nr:Crp/Fnr family transcriptional regulator [Mucilaginibacter sp.]
MATNKFNEYLSSLPHMRPVLLDELRGIAGSEIIRNRQVRHSGFHTPPQLLFIEEGLLHRYYINEQGAQVSIGFFVPGEALLLLGKPRDAENDYLESLQHTQVRTIAQQDVEHLLPEYPEIKLAIIHLIRTEFAREAIRTRLLHMPAILRYSKFRELSPGVFRNVPLRLIASYLNMTRENLSRLIGRER